MRITFAAVLLALSAACTPTCESVCKKVIECDVSSRLAQDECERECARQDTLYDSWEDVAKQDAYAAHKTCIVDSTCDALDEGVCYDEEIFLF